jgi:peptide deformylase
MPPLNIVVVNATTRDSPDVAVRRPARELRPDELGEHWFRDLVADLFESLYATPGGIGLAAPQVGVLLKVAVISLRDGTPPLVLVNPSYEPDGEAMDVIDERCLSVPDFAAPVPRYLSIRARYIDQHGQSHEALQGDFLARVMQHEIDHLNGILCIDRVADKSLIRAETGGYPERQAARVADELFNETRPAD